MLFFFFTLVLTNDDELRYCFKQNQDRLGCKVLSSGVQKVAPTDDGVWYVNKDGTLSFAEFNRNPITNVYSIDEKSFSTRLNDLISTLHGDVWGILRNGTVIKMQGLSVVKPYGTDNDWVVLPINGKRLLTYPNGVLIETDDGKMIQEKSECVLYKALRVMFRKYEIFTAIF